MVRSASRGAALVEAVVMLPALLVLFLGARELLARHAAELETAGRARACAWVVASSGCKDIPRECSTVTIRAPGEGGDSSMDGPRNELAKGNWLSRAILEIPLLGSTLMAILPDEVDTNVTTVLARSASSRGVLTVSGRAAVPCNEMPHEESILKEVVDAAMP